MLEALHTGVVSVHVVPRPERAEEFASGGELADKVREFAVVRVAAGFGAEDRDGVMGDAIPVEVEASRRRGTA
jgi:hypothetical protein